MFSAMCDLIRSTKPCVKRIVAPKLFRHNMATQHSTPTPIPRSLVMSHYLNLTFLAISKDIQMHWLETPKRALWRNGRNTILCKSWISLRQICHNASRIKERDAPHVEKRPLPWPQHLVFRMHSLRLCPTLDPKKLFCRFLAISNDS